MGRTGVRPLVSCEVWYDFCAAAFGPEEDDYAFTRGACRVQHADYVATPRRSSAGACGCVVRCW